MGQREKYEKLTTDHREAKYRFILTELDLALTFCEMAMTSGEEEKSRRNTDNAQRAFDAVNHFLEDAGFSGAMEIHVQQKLTRLKTMLKRLNAQPSGTS